MQLEWSLWCNEDKKGNNHRIKGKNSEIESFFTCEVHNMVQALFKIFIFRNIRGEKTLQSSKEFQMGEYRDRANSTWMTAKFFSTNCSWLLEKQLKYYSGTRNGLKCKT